MPKKSVGANSKAVAAKEKKSKAKDALLLKKEQEHEDQKWVDTCEVVEKRLKRTQEKIDKREEQLKRKNELKEILKQESQCSCKSKIKFPSKLTRMDIAKKFTSGKTLNDLVKKNETQLSTPLTENINRLTLGEEIARTIDEALSLLTEDNSVQDKHQEKRLKAGHKAFEEKRLKELRAAHPSLKLSQLKGIIFKEWQKLQQK